MEADEHRDAEQLVGRRCDEVVVRARVSICGNDPGVLGELLKASSIGLAEHRQQRQDEVGLSQGGATGIDAQEDLGDLLLIDLVADLYGLEGVVLEPADPSERVAERRLLAIGEPLWGGRSEALYERVDDCSLRQSTAM
jgi:hypothetical protein